MIRPISQRRGFALMAALGVVAALIVLTAAVSSTVLYGISGSARLQKDREHRVVAEAGARRALAGLQTGASASLQYEIGKLLCRVNVEPLAAEDKVYSESGLAFRPGDVRIETRTGVAPRGMRAVWLANASPGAKRMILLERGALLTE